jgi:osmotically-inducible protein OsmY
VRANLAVTPDTSALELDVTAQGGVVLIKGKVENRDQVKNVEAVVRVVPGVADVKLELFTEIRV